MALFADPNLTSTTLNPACSTLLSLGVCGNGPLVSLGGSADIPDGDVTLQGGGTGAGITVTGRLIVNAITSSTNTKTGSGLTLRGTGLTITRSCTVFEDAVGSGTTQQVAASPPAEAVIQYECTATGLVDFTYDSAGP